MIFVDAAAWIAFYWVEDRHHVRASAFYQEALAGGETFLSTYEVFSESASLLRRRAGLGPAVEFGEAWFSSRVLTRLEVGDDVRREAWILFRAQHDVPLSFVDCISFAVMRRHEISKAFTFDADFTAMGFEVVPVA